MGVVIFSVLSSSSQILESSSEFSFLTGSLLCWSCREGNRTCCKTNIYHSECKNCKLGDSPVPLFGNIEGLIEIAYGKMQIGMKCFNKFQIRCCRAIHIRTVLPYFLCAIDYKIMYTLYIESKYGYIVGYCCMDN